MMKVIRLWLMALIITTPVVFASTTTIQKSPNDKREYQYLELNNGMKIVLISDKDSEKASAVLQVNLGSFSDPEKFAGLAHFLEHMLFLGTKKYPEADAYQKFIEKHGGSSNAMTDSERTVYYFDVLPSHFEPALDHFSQFFINPLFNAELVERERNAVDSEYQTHKKNDFIRFHYVFKQLANPKHPFSRFNIGSLTTLKADNNLKLREAVVDFFNQHYNANTMILALTGPQSLKELEKLATTYFNEVPNRSAKTEVSYLNEKLILPEQLRKRVNVVPVGKRQYLSLVFPVPDQNQFYQSKPDFYVSKLIDNTSENSLYHYLYNKKWAELIDADYYSITTTQGIYSIDVDLTPEGAKHVDEIVTAIFSYLNLIKAQGLAQWRHDENRKIANLGFKFLEKASPVDSALRIVRNARLYPIKDVITADYSFDSYNPTLIENLLSYLTSDNMLLFVSHKNVTGNKTEPYFQASYSIEDIDDEKLTLWKNTTLADLKLPEVNSYIVDENKVAYQAYKNSVTQTPKLVLDEAEKRVWCMNDSIFKNPKILFNYSLVTPVVEQSPEASVLADIYIKLANQLLIRKLYPAVSAGNSFSLGLHSRGIAVSVEGYNTEIIKHIADDINQVLLHMPIDPQRFETTKKIMLQDYDNMNYIKPVERGFKEIRSVLLQPSWPIESLRSALQKINVERFENYSKKLLSAVSFEFLAFGNVDCAKIVNEIQPITDAYNFTEKPFKDTSIKVVNLSPGKTYVRDISTKHNDHSMVMLFQPMENTDKTKASLMLLSQILSEPFFTELRTKQQLGYIVGVTEIPFEETMLLGYYIESPHYTPSDIFKRMNAFHQKAHETLLSISQEDLQRHKQSLKELLLQKPINRYDLHSRYWSEILNRHFKFDRRQRLADALASVTATDLSGLYHQMHLNKGNYKRLILKTAKQKESIFDEFYTIKSPIKFKQQARFFENEFVKVSAGG